MARGGYQRPTSPAPVSGPGALAQRTDGGPAAQQPIRNITGLPYGEGQAMTNLQGMAPMEAASPTPSMPASSMSGGSVAPEPIVPMNAPSMRPGEPVTHGADAGPGPGLASLGLGQKDIAADNEFRTAVASYMPVLLHVASRSTTSPETRNVIRQLRELM